jgi:hypothetical protein
MHVKEAALWMYLVKLGAVDPTIRAHVKRVAKAMGVKPPSKKELDHMFPKGWENKAPSWQVQLENSEWLKNMNARKAGGGGIGSAVRGAGARARRAGVGGVAKGLLRKSWTHGVPLGAVGSSIGSLVKAHKLEKDLGKDLTTRQREDLFKKSKGWKSVAIGSGLGALGGAALPALDLALSARKGQRLSTLKNLGPALGLSSMWGLTLGSNIGSMRAMDKVREKAKEMGYIKPKKKLLKAAAEDTSLELPKHHLAKRLGVIGLLGGLGAGAVLKPSHQILKTWLKRYPKGSRTMAALRSSVPVDIGKKMVHGGIEDAISGGIGGAFSGGIADQLVRRYQAENKS